MDIDSDTDEGSRTMRRDASIATTVRTSPSTSVSGRRSSGLSVPSRLSSATTCLSWPSEADSKNQGAAHSRRKSWPPQSDGIAPVGLIALSDAAMQCERAFKTPTRSQSRRRHRAAKTVQSTLALPPTALLRACNSLPVPDSPPTRDAAHIALFLQTGGTPQPKKTGRGRLTFAPEKAVFARAASFPTDRRSRKRQALDVATEDSKYVQHGRVRSDARAVGSDSIETLFWDQIAKFRELHRREVHFKAVAISQDVAHDSQTRREMSQIRNVLKLLGLWGAAQRELESPILKYFGEGG